MHVIYHHLQFVNHKTVLAGDIPQDALASALNVANQNLITILRAENHVKTNLPETMAHAKQIHSTTSKAVPKKRGRSPRAALVTN